MENGFNSKLSTMVPKEERLGEGPYQKPIDNLGRSFSDFLRRARKQKYIENQKPPGSHKPFKTYFEKLLERHSCERFPKSKYFQISESAEERKEKPVDLANLGKSSSLIVQNDSFSADQLFDVDEELPACFKENSHLSSIRSSIPAISAEKQKEECGERNNFKVPFAFEDKVKGPSEALMHDEWEQPNPISSSLSCRDRISSKRSVHFLQSNNSDNSETEFAKDGINLAQKEYIRVNIGNKQGLRSKMIKSDTYLSQRKRNQNRKRTTKMTLKLLNDSLHKVEEIPCSESKTSNSTVSNSNREQIFRPCYRISSKEVRIKLFAPRYPSNVSENRTKVLRGSEEFATKVGEDMICSACINDNTKFYLDDTIKNRKERLVRLKAMDVTPVLRIGKEKEEESLSDESFTFAEEVLHRVGNLIKRAHDAGAKAIDRLSYVLLGIHDDESDEDDCRESSKGRLECVNSHQSQSFELII